MDGQQVSKMEKESSAISKRRQLDKCHKRYRKAVQALVNLNEKIERDTDSDISVESEQG